MTRPPEFDARLLAYLPALRKTARRLLPDMPGRREDLVHETIATALARWRQFRADGGFHAWLVLLMRDAVRTLRRRERISAASVDILSITLAVPPTQEDVVEARQVLAALDDLPPRKAAVMHLVALGFSDVEIAAAEGCTHQNIAQHRRSAQAALLAAGYAHAA